MSSDSDAEDVIAYYRYRKKRRVIQRKNWCNPRNETRPFTTAEHLNRTDDKFFALFKMSKDSYLELLKRVAPSIKKNDTNMRECVTSEERILITLRYLGDACSFTSLSRYFRRGETTVGNIIKETTKIIWDVLNEIYMPVPSEDRWKTIAESFNMLLNLPHCIGALYEKHIQIQKIANAGSVNFNYKYINSVVLLASCDPDGLFTMIETGCTGRNNGAIFKASAMNQRMTQSALNIPSPSPLHFDEQCSPFPYYFVGDEALTLTHNLMTPYKKKNLDDVKRIFNYRLSRGRETFESVFEMAAKRFPVLNGPIRCRNNETMNDIVKAACILHNFVHKLEGINFIPKVTQEEHDVEGVPIVVPRQPVINEGSSAFATRNYLANYFLSPRASIPCQWKYALSSRNKK